MALLTFVDALVHVADAGSLKFCTTEKRSERQNDALMRSCANLKLKSSDISCVVASDRLSCLRMIQAGTADFTVLEPEDLSLATLSTAKEGDAAVDIRVTHELRMFDKGQPQLDVEMIALVKNRFDNRWVTKNKKLCYIGLEIGHSQNYHYHYTTYFERWLIPRGCDRNKTLLENRLADLSSHFESACIAGPWSLDSVYDGRLKSKYRNLCALCGSPSGCFEGDKFYGLQGAINCLLENVGDIAWLSRSHALPYFAELASYGFSLLCPDGMFIPLSVNKTCTWIAEPRSVIAARSDVADLVSKKVSDVQELGKDFYPVIHATYKFSYLASTRPLSPEDYMLKFQGYLSAKGEKTCQPEREVRWCVASNLEASKCGWLQSAAAALDVEPRISCIQQRDRQAALDAVRDDRCDVFVARPHEEIHARGMNLTPIVHLISKQNLDSSRYAAIVRKDAKFRSFDDLKGKRACFTAIKSVGWNAFYSAIRGSSPRLPCDDVEAVSRFFNRSCVYDLDGREKSSLPENLYSLCNQSHFEKSLGPEENTFKCLMNGADVAFVNVGAAKRYYSGFSIFHMNYRTLCENEDRLDEGPCFLAETTLGSVLGRKNITQVRREEIYQLFLQLDRFFGRTHDRETAMFMMYNTFDGQSDVIFPDQTQLIQRHVSDLRHSRTYEEVLASLQDKVECGSSGAPTVASSAWTISAIAVLGLLRIL
ncbi:transferrin-like [Trichogramma pretiosum]|uniref:transferrin-like n=1 Tax=Trichogramma pretiosum TaxID=7493 RepID=UPI000C71A8D0|nr:transferrin-like [Trichogramma pretiosum]